MSPLEGRDPNQNISRICAAETTFLDSPQKICCVVVTAETLGNHPTLVFEKLDRATVCIHTFFLKKMDGIVQAACDFISSMLNWDRYDGSISREFIVENMKSTDFQLFAQQLSNRSQPILVYPTPILMDKFIGTTKAIVSLSFDTIGNGEYGSLRISVDSLPDGFVALKSLPRSISSSHSADIDATSWLAALSQVPFRTLCRFDHPGESVEIVTGEEFHCCHRLPEEGVATDNKLFDENMMKAAESPSTAEEAIRSVIGKSLTACIVAADSGSASVWIGVDTSTRVAIGTPFGAPALLSIYQTAVKSIISDLVPAIPLEGVRITVHELRFAQVENFSKPVMRRVKSFSSALVALRFLQGRAAIGRDASNSSGTQYVVIVDEAVLLRAVQLADIKETACNEWERLVQKSEFRDSCRWMKNPAAYFSYESGKLEVTRRWVIHVSVHVPFEIRGAVFKPIDAMAYLPSFDTVPAQNQSSSSSNSSSSSSSSTYNTSGSPMGVPVLESDVMSWFQIWLRARAVTSCISGSLLSYALTICPVTTRVLCFKDELEKSRLEYALQVYAHAPVPVDAFVRNNADFQETMKLYSNALLIGSVSTICMFLSRSSDNMHRNRVLLFTTLSDITKHDSTLHILRRVTVADMCLFPVEPIFTESAVTLTHAPLAVPAADTIPNLSESELNALARTWLLKQQHSMKDKVPWELINAGLIGSSDQSLHLQCLVEATKHKRPPNQRVQVVQVCKQCRCCGATTALQLVAWNIQNSGGHNNVKCFFVGADSQTPEERKIITNLSNQNRASWIVFFVDDDVRQIENVVQALWDSAATCATVVNVTNLANDDMHVISPYLQIDSIRAMLKVLERVWPDCGGAIHNLITHIVENSHDTRPTEPMLDSHIFVCVLTASNGRFQPIVDIVSECFPVDGEQGDIATVLCLLSAHTARPVVRCNAFNETALGDLLGGKFRALLDTSIPSFLSVMHPFVAELSLGHATSSLIDAVSVMRKVLSFNMQDWEYYARSLLISRPKGKLFSSFVSALLAGGTTRPELFKLLDGPVAVNVHEPYRQIVKSRLLRLHYSHVEDILLLASTAADELSVTPNQSYLGWNNYLQALCFVRDHQSTSAEEITKIEDMIREVEGKLPMKTQSAAWATMARSCGYREVCDDVDESGQTASENGSTSS
jgi:hypothetical protein